MLLRDQPVLFSDYTDKGVSKTEGLHNYNCERTLNDTKYSSTKAVYTELGRGPIMNKAWGMAIKYWIRLENGTANTFLNEAYTEAKRNEHSWLQSIQYVLCKNGFREMWLDKTSYDHRVFHKYFLQRLDDQFKQNLSCDIASSARFSILSSLKDHFGMSSYLTHIHNPSIRNIFTRLRIDLNYLATCKTQGNFSMCPMCKLEPETVEHITIHRRGMEFVCFHEAGNIYVLYPWFTLLLSRLIIPSRTKIILILIHLKLMKENTKSVMEPYVTTSWSSLHCDRT